MKQQNRILLLGGSGKLGKEIIQSNLFEQIYFPTKEICDLENKESIDSILNQYKPTHVINCAALARRKICQTNPKGAISINIIGTSQLVQSILDFRTRNIEPRLLHISTDAVYHCGEGNYDEYDPTIPICNYGWTKLAAECSVRLLNNYLIVRTRFFNPKKIPFLDAANDIFTSSIPVSRLVRLIYKLTFIEYIGVLNVGDKSQSDFDKYKKHKSDILQTDMNSITKDSSLPFCRDYTLSTKRLDSISL
tara:strand:+ start:307 stop:1053 length:747 start_codon:yes stop_codon:yes gene_type:complete